MAVVEVVGRPSGSRPRLRARRRQRRPRSTPAITAPRRPWRNLKCGPSSKHLNSMVSRNLMCGPSSKHLNYSKQYSICPYIQCFSTALVCGVVGWGPSSKYILNSIVSPAYPMVFNCFFF
ncbi:hypothetical protein M8J76_015934 [Diaphorina citri]|nr:hypothetical protein M8J76_015934 [Diaphorina citri]